MPRKCINMNDYVQVNFTLSPYPGTDATDLLAALLGDEGFESFVETPNGMTAYAPVSDYKAEGVCRAVEALPFECKVSFETEVVEGRDWNEEWEKNYFQPIVVADKCVVHSSFHTDIPNAEFDIVIDPKMAFGTGHHATTSLVLEQLIQMSVEKKSVIDMGTGTGILAILAAMRGANPVTGIEIDEFAWTNAVENVALNGHSEIAMLLGGAEQLSALAPADIFVANINRNVITTYIKEYAAATATGGIMLLSGFYEADIPVVASAAEPYGLSVVSHTVRDNWTCLKLAKA